MKKTIKLLILWQRKNIPLIYYFILVTLMYSVAIYVDQALTKILISLIALPLSIICTYKYLLYGHFPETKLGAEIKNRKVIWIIILLLWHMACWVITCLSFSDGNYDLKVGIAGVCIGLLSFFLFYSFTSSIYLKHKDGKRSLLL